MVACVKDPPGCKHATSSGPPEQSGLRAVRSDLSSIASSFASKSPRPNSIAVPPSIELILPLPTRGLGLRIFRLPLRPKKLHGDLVGATEPVDQSRSRFPPRKGVTMSEVRVNARENRAVARSPRYQLRASLPTANAASEFMRSVRTHSSFVNVPRPTKSLISLSSPGRMTPSSEGSHLPKFDR